MKTDSVVQKFGPGYTSEEDIADAPSVVQVPPSPMESDADKDNNEKKHPMEKAMKKQGGRDIGKKKINGIKADQRLTSALKTPPTITIMRKVYYTQIWSRLA